ncbi:MAG: hypothetical protein ACD_63C00054G0007 [uncultured bacterium]|nr:MAG: hypothetical protein ACD_63C00054G0007 [uncultured bacterium]
MKNPWKLISFFVGGLLVLSLVLNYFIVENFRGDVSELQADVSGQDLIDTVQEPTVSIVPKDVSVDDDPFTGNQDAKVTLIVFDDFECPFCKEMHENLDEVRKKFSKEDLRIVYRDFPLAFHKNALPAAKAAGAAAKQRKFILMSNEIFENAENLSDDKYKEFAKSLDLDMDQFEKDFASDEVAEEIKKDVSDGESYGVSGTPAAFLNGEKIGGLVEIEKLEELINSKL